jgi:PhnB protein
VPATTPHLHFQGNCREAFEFYAATLGGRIVFAMTYGEAPGADEYPPDWRGKVIHGRLDLGHQAITGCDVPGERYQKPQGFNLMIGIDEPADAERVFRTLAEGGAVTMPCQETFWALRFGMCTDRYGIPWMVNCAKPQDAVVSAARKSA